MNLRTLQARRQKSQAARMQAMLKSPAIPTAYTEGTPLEVPHA